MELDALNAIHAQLVLTNELLQRMIDGNLTATNIAVQPVQPIKHTTKRTYTRRANNNAG
jgi:hypothetical protein